MVSASCLNGQFTDVQVHNSGSSSDCTTYDTKSDYADGSGFSVLVTPTDHCGKDGKGAENENNSFAFCFFVQ